MSYIKERLNLININVSINVSYFSLINDYLRSLCTNLTVSEGFSRGRISGV